ncbi:MAG: hypothetical protein HW375_1590 [Anaerolineales bacterium]|nr:hypothetical protein [Anaerolineales bacterium]
MVEADVRRHRDSQRPRRRLLRSEAGDGTRPYENRLPRAALRQVEVVAAQDGRHESSLDVGLSGFLLIDGQQALVDLVGGLAQGGCDRSGCAEIGLSGVVDDRIERPLGQDRGRSPDGQEQHFIAAAAGGPPRRGLGQRTRRRAYPGASAGDMDQGDICFKRGGHRPRLYPDGSVKPPDARTAPP